MEAYCLTCKSMREMQLTVRVKLTSGKEVTKGYCPICKREMSSESDEPIAMKVADSPSPPSPTVPMLLPAFSPLAIFKLSSLDAKMWALAALAIIVMVFLCRPGNPVPAASIQSTTPTQQMEPSASAAPLTHAQTPVVEKSTFDELSSSPSMAKKAREIKGRHPDWNDGCCVCCAEGVVNIGMTKGMVRECWGNPVDITRDHAAGYSSEIWVYSLTSKRAVVFIDGQVSSYQD